MEFHTFSRKDEKLFKAVIRGLPANIEEDLPDELSSVGFPGCKTTKLRSAASPDTQNALFLVQLGPGSDISKFRKLKFLCRCVIEIEKFRPKYQTATQCFRCQNFGHTSSNCNLPPRCVKCTAMHLSKDCEKKDRQEKAQCCNCDDHHAANYRLCPAQQSYLKRTHDRNLHTRASLRPPRSAIKEVNDGRTWSQVTAGSSQYPTATAPVTKTSQANNLNPINPPHHHMAASAKESLDPTTAEMLQVFTILKSIKDQFKACDSMVDKVILILTHLGQYV